MVYKMLRLISAFISLILYGFERLRIIIAKFLEKERVEIISWKHILIN